MISKQKRKRIFYVPGMISLVLIPLFCFYHFYKVDAFKVNAGINLHLPNKESFFEYKIPSLRKYKVFNFNENEISEKKKLQDMQLYLRKLANNKDTINGIKIHFGLKTNYDVFIRTIDILDEENAPDWTINENDIYILGSTNTYKKVKDTIQYDTMNCGTLEIMRRQAYWEQKEKIEEEKHNFQLSFFKQKWILISFGYFGLVLLNIFVLVKFNRSK
ncbi:hypothetical protein [Flavobacterium reichenbachii]|uniref:Uncharacterized protein n=1 Tax=Flavobacterium reichenbachii TaxID=362418 RepID=A0A085ZKR5_9FLAO|nr:hypothetical protein [Flavobacterium reichenbachii]KFF05029.1 hypothetical protein IW19_05580 [Flavobacterium reichenbachii]OXB16298.1 hypothetical protein B0A68_08570 [Flavobacterium reichenbachii]